MHLNSSERRQLATTLGCATETVSSKIKEITNAAQEEYLRMALGQRVFTRGQDIREYRLYLLIVHVFGGRLPTEQQISSLFQTTTTQSRALLRAVMSKYQYELQDAILNTLREKLEEARQDQNSDGYLITIDSENVIEALNRRITAIDGTLPQISKARGTVSTYEIAASSYKSLVESLR